MNFFCLTSLNSAKIDTLIKMNYFKDYGTIDKLQSFVKAIDILHDKSQFNKESVPVAFETIIKKYTEETAKMYRKFDYESALKEVWDLIPNTEPSVSKIIHYQNELFGYVSYTDPSRPNTAVVMDVNTKYSTFKVQLYCLGNGQTITAKLQKKMYQNIPLAVGTVITYRTESKPGWKKLDNGDWEKDPSKTDIWLSYYDVEL